MASTFSGRQHVSANQAGPLNADQMAVAYTLINQHSPLNIRHEQRAAVRRCRNNTALADLIWELTPESERATVAPSKPLPDWTINTEYDLPCSE